MARSRDPALFTPRCDVIAARIPCCNSCQLVLAGFSPLHAAGAPHGGRLGHRGPHAEPRNAAPGTTRISLLRMPRSTRGTVTPLLRRISNNAVQPRRTAGRERRNDRPHPSGRGRRPPRLRLRPIPGSVSTDTGTILAHPEGAAPRAGEGMLGFLGSISRFAPMLFGSVTLPHYALGGC